MGIVFGPYLLMGDELGRATDIDRLLASSGLYIPIFTLIGNNSFFNCFTDFRWKMSPKMGDFEFSWISRLDRVGFANCLDLHMHHYSCATVSASNFQVLQFAVVDALRPQEALSAFWLAHLVENVRF